MDRIGWNPFFMEVAGTVSRRGSCNRLQVGAVLVDTDRGIISTGYNGAARGTPSCDEVGCLMINDRCERSIHAELNALIQAGRNGASTKGASLYCTHRPCHRCVVHLVQAGISEIIYWNDYKSDNADHVLELLRHARVCLWKLEGNDLKPANNVSESTVMWVEKF